MSASDRALHFIATSNARMLHQSPREDFNKTFGGSPSSQRQRNNNYHHSRSTTNNNSDALLMMARSAAAAAGSCGSSAVATTNNNRSGRGVSSLSSPSADKEKNSKRQASVTLPSYHQDHDSFRSCSSNKKLPTTNSNRSSSNNSSNKSSTMTTSTATGLRMIARGVVSDSIGDDAAFCSGSHPVGLESTPLRVSSDNSGSIGNGGSSTTRKKKRIRGSMNDSARSSGDPDYDDNGDGLVVDDDDIDDHNESVPGSSLRNRQKTGPNRRNLKSASATAGSTGGGNSSSNSTSNLPGYLQPLQRFTASSSTASSSITTTTITTAAAANIMGGVGQQQSKSLLVSGPSVSDGKRDAQPSCQLSSRIHSELNDIKKRIPIAAVLQATLNVISSSCSNSNSSSSNNNSNVRKDGSPLFVCERSSPNNEEEHQPLYQQQQQQQSSGSSLSHQLAVERDQHRQRLDEVWRCAQGWRARARGIEQLLRNLVAEMLSNEVKRLLENEEKTRWGLVAREQEEFQATVMFPFLSVLQKNVLPGALGHSSSSCSCGGCSSGRVGQPGYRVKDSDLLRALRAAETRLAQLGEPPTRQFLL